MLRVRTMDDMLTLPERLYQVQRLLPQSFVQAARGVLVNLDRIECFEPLPNGLILVPDWQIKNMSISPANMPENCASD